MSDTPRIVHASDAGTVLIFDDGTLELKCGANAPPLRMRLWDWYMAGRLSPDSQTLHGGAEIKEGTQL